MDTDETSSVDGGDLVLITAQPRAGSSAAGAVMVLAVLGGVGWGMWRLSDTPGLARWSGWIALGLLGVVLLRALDRHVRQLGSWLRWRGRPLPAMRLTASGLDYSPAYTGGFELHVPWGVPMTCAYRRGPDNTGFLWCLYAPVVNGLGPLPAMMHRQWPLDAAQLISERRELLRTLAVNDRSPARAAAVTHLVTYGTPIVINTYLVSGDSLGEFDQRLRDHTGGECTLQPPRHRIGPTVGPTFW
jgi:hypothetical protein